MNTTPPTPPEDQLSGQNPWPGLRAFTENDRDFFFGRGKEATELFGLLQRAPAVVLYGQSGLGKTSLLLAGLFPRLRERDFLPLRLRFDHGPGAPPLARQITLALAAELDRLQVQAPRPEANESLWEYFHRRDVDFWGPRNRLLTPVVVLDQFEEVFTVGQKDAAAAARVSAFAAELEALLEHLPPAAIRDRLEENPEKALRYDLQRQSLRLLLSLREDFLPHLDTWRAQIPSLLPHRFRLERLSVAQAIQVVTLAGRDLVDPAVAGDIVDFVSASQRRRATGGALEQREVEPALLSVVCDELNRRRIEKGQARITSDLLSGESVAIIQGFYERAFLGIDAGTRDWVESELLTASGFRDRAALEDALGLGLAADDFDQLVDRRLLHREERDGVIWLELTHDLLTDPAAQSRNSGEQRRLAQAAAAREAEIRRRLRRTQLHAAAYAILALAAIGALIFAIITNRSAEAARQEAVDARKKVEEALTDAIAARRSAEAARAEAFLQQQFAEAARSEAERSQAEMKSARDRAELNFRKAAEAADRVAFDALRKARDAMRSPTAELEELISAAQPPLVWLADQPGGSIERQLRLMEFHILASEIYYDLGHYKKGLKHARLALDRSSTLEPSKPTDNDKRQLNLAQASHAVGWGLLQQGSLQAAQRHFQRAREALLRLDPAKPEALRLRALVEIGLSEIETRRFAVAAAEKRLLGTLKLLRARRSEDSNGELAALEVQALRRLGESKVEAVPDAAVDHVEEAQSLLRKLVSSHPDNLRWQRLRAQLSNLQGRVLLNLGRLDEAAKSYEQALKISGELSIRDRQNRDWMFGLAQSYQGQGWFHLQQGDSTQAAALLKNAADTAGEVTKLESLWIDAHVNLAVAKIALGELDSSLPDFEAAQRALERAARISGEEAQISRYMGWMNVYSGLAHVKHGDTEQAFALYEKSLAILSQMRARGVNAAVLLQDEILVQRSIGDLLLSEERYTDATAAYSKLVALTRDRAAEHPTAANNSELALAHQSLSRSRLAVGDRVGAVDALRQSVAVVSEGIARHPQHAGLLERAKEAQDLHSSLDEEKQPNPNARRLSIEVEALSKSVAELVETTGWSLRPLFPGPWRTLGPEEQRAEIERAPGTVLEDELVSDRVMRLRALRLSFFEDAILYEAELSREGKSPAGLLYVRHPHGVTRLNGTSPPIHEMNAREGILLNTREQAEDYLRFFCSAIAGDEGPFTIIESIGDATWSAKAELDINVFAKDIKPLTVIPAPDGAWLAWGTIQYSNALFYVTMQITKTGMVEMLTDEPFLADLPILPLRYSEGLRDITPETDQ